MGLWLGAQPCACAEVPAKNRRKAQGATFPSLPKVGGLFGPFSQAT